MCEIDIDDCAGVTCPGANTICYDQVNSYICACKPGYEGNKLKQIQSQTKVSLVQVIPKAW